jgi:hypothetical protein
MSLSHEEDVEEDENLSGQPDAETVRAWELSRSA